MLIDTLHQAGYRPNAKTGVWAQANSPPVQFSYSDGDVEAEMYQQLLHVGDLSCGSQELAALGTDWPRHYHFSTHRADLLRPLSHLLKGVVLEIGAGCGAISRYLGETAAHVVALEGSPRRAAIARRRCQDLDNLQVVAAHAMAFTPIMRFDAVVLVGVLEYSRCFIDAPDPVQAMLAHCKSFLRPDGVLIVAIENQLGLKYFGGAPEDHVSVPFFGINDSYSERSVVTFGKQELTCRLAQAGLVGARFYYPFPDYKMPATVMTQEGAGDPSEAMQNVAASLNARSINLPYSRPFSEERAWPLLLRNGLLGDLANSFLVVARERPITAADDVIRRAGDLAHVYSTSRPREFAKETILTRQDDAIEVTRRRLYPNFPAQIKILHQVIEDEHATQAPALSRKLSNIINTPGWSVGDLTAWAQPWLAYLKAHQVPQGGDNPSAFAVPGSLIDCSPGNLLVKDDASLQGFDFEWQVQQSIPANWPLFRGLFYALLNHASVAPPQGIVPHRLVDLVQDTMRGLGIETSSGDIAELLKLESAFFNASPDAICRAQLTVRQS